MKEWFWLMTDAMVAELKASPFPGANRAEQFQEAYTNLLGRLRVEDAKTHGFDHRQGPSGAG